MSDYQPGKALILSRLPAKEWFRVEEVAEHSGWCRSYVQERIKDGMLPAQESMAPDTGKRRKLIHIDDLVLFIIRHGKGRYREEKPIADVITIVRSWPKFMRREFMDYITKHP